MPARYVLRPRGALSASGEVVTLVEIQALAAEGGFPLAFTHPRVQLAGAFVWLGQDEIVARLRNHSILEFAVDFSALAEVGFAPSDGWYPLGGFW